MKPQTAPDFTLPDQTGELRSLRDYRGRWVVLFFYTQDDSLGCTKQACSFRDEYRVIQQFGNAEVIGINQAPTKQHLAFTKKHHLNFPILSDEDHSVTATYNSWSSLSAAVLGKNYATQRNTFLIDPAGNIIKKYSRVKRSVQHTEQVIQDLQQFQAAAA